MSRKRDRQEQLAREVAHLDDIELDSAWESALRGDMEVVELRLARVKCQEVRIQSLRKPDSVKSDTPWRKTSSWLFGRRAFSTKID